MAIKDVLTRGIGPSTSLAFFITGGYESGNTTATLTTTITNETSVARNQNSIILVLAGHTHAGDSFLPLTSAIAQDIIDGLTSAQNEDDGWNNRVRDQLQTPSVTRVSDGIMRIDLPAFGAYSITANETVTATLPASAFTLGAAIAANPTITVTNVAVVGTAITNSDSTDSVTSNYVIDDRTGFKMYPGELVKDGHIPGFMTSKKAHDPKQPQENIRSVGDRQRGPESPELDNTFIETAISSDDL